MVSTSARNAGDPWFESRSWYDRFLYVNIHLFILMPVSCNSSILLKKKKKIKNIYIYIYNGEIKMYFNLAMVGFEPTPTSAAAPSNTETTVLPSRPLRSL